MRACKLLLAAALAAALPAQAAVYAVVVGVNEYPARFDGKSLVTLRGAVNDAEDVAAALKQAGAADVRLLTNAAATKAAILSSWAELAGRAKAGDTLVFTFAGHGSQIPELIAGSEADGKDEILLLGGMGAGEGRVNVLVDNEWRSLLQQVPASVTVVSLLDACHSGTAYRGGGSSRQIAPLSAGAFTIGKIPPKEPDTQANEIVAAATTDDGVVFEDFIVDGKPRGVASAVFARALRGDADADRSGGTSVDELKSFFNKQVLNLSSGKQVGTVAATGDGARLLFDATPGFALPEVRDLAISINGPGLELFDTLQGVVSAPAAQAALRWESGLGLVFDASGEVVATRILNAESFQGVLDKFRLLGALDAVAKVPRLAVTSELPDSLLRAGQRTNIHVLRGLQPHLTVINLANDGTVNLLYPVGGEPSAPNQPEFLIRDIEAGVPYGREHILVLATEKPPKALRQLLAQINEQRRSLRLWPELAALLRGPPGSVELGQGALQTIGENP